MRSEGYWRTELTRIEKSWHRTNKVKDPRGGGTVTKKGAEK